MKRLRHAILLFFIFAFSTLVFLQLFLNTQLTTIARKTILPRLNTCMGVPVDTEKVSFNILTAQATVTGFNIANPRIFAEPYVMAVQKIRFQISPLALPAKKIRIRRAGLQGLRVNLVCDKRGRYNTGRIHRYFRKYRELVYQNNPPTEPRKTPWVYNVHTLNATGLINYTDYRFTETPFSIALETDLQVRDMVYTEEPSQNWSTFTLTGHQAGEPQGFVTELSGRMAALNPGRDPSFDLQGKVSGISPVDFTNLVGTLDITGETLTIEVDLKCRNGSFLKGQSKLTLHIDRPELIGRLGQKAQGMSLPDKLVIPAPLEGTFDTPIMNLPEAVFNAVTHSLVGSPAKMIEPARAIQDEM